MNRKLLIRKEKRTYVREDDGKHDYESNLALQTITNEGVQVQPVENENIESLIKKSFLKRFIFKLEEDKRIDNYLKLIQERYVTTNYEVNVGIEDVLIRKYFLEMESMTEIHYRIVTYSILEDTKVICSEFLVFEGNCDELVQKVCDKIDEELEWHKTEKIRCKSTPLIWIFSQEVAGYFFHECIGHILEEDLFRISKYKLGDVFFKNKLNIYENWIRESTYDDLGNEIREKICLVRDGRIENYLSGYNAPESICSGNAFTEEAYLPPKIRMSNMFVEGSDTTMNLFENIAEAIYIKELSGGECDPFTGEVGLCVKKACYISNGRIDYVYEPFSLLFNLRNLEKVEIKTGCNKKTIQSLCFKYGAVKKIKYTTPDILIDWRQNSECITDRNF